jgi:hypothetical protein
MYNLVKITSFRHFSWKLPNNKWNWNEFESKKPKCLTLVVIRYLSPFPTKHIFPPLVISHHLPHKTKENLGNNTLPPTSDLGINIPWWTTQFITYKQQKHKKTTKCNSSKVHDHQLSPFLAFSANTSINIINHSLRQSHPTSSS